MLLKAPLPLCIAAPLEATGWPPAFKRKLEEFGSLQLYESNKATDPEVAEEFMSQ